MDFWIESRGRGANDWLKIENPAQPSCFNFTSCLSRLSRRWGCCCGSGSTSFNGNMQMQEHFNPQVVVDEELAFPNTLNTWITLFIWSVLLQHSHTSCRPYLFSRRRTKNCYPHILSCANAMHGDSCPLPLPLAWSSTSVCFVTSELLTLPLHNLNTTPPALSLRCCCAGSLSLVSLSYTRCICCRYLV